MGQGRPPKHLPFSETDNLHQIKRFDIFTLEIYITANTLIREIVIACCTQRLYDKQENLCARSSIMRRFAIFTNHLGVNAYIIL